jgi:hypothetical protein
MKRPIKLSRTVALSFEAVSHRLNVLMKAPIYIKISVAAILLAATMLVLTNSLPKLKQSWKSGTTVVSLSKDGTLSVKPAGWIFVKRSGSMFEEMRIFWYWWVRYIEVSVGRGKMANYHYPPRMEDMPPWIDFNHYFMAIETDALLNSDYPPWHGARKLMPSYLVVKEGVKHIGDYAFAGFSSLKSAEIPSSVASIGYMAFGEYTGLTAINVSEDNLAYSSVDGVLYNKTKDTLILLPRGKHGAYTIPNSVTYIDLQKSFLSYADLTAIDVNEDNSVYSSVDGVLYNKAKDILILCPRGKKGAYTIPNGVTFIATAAFRNTKLTSVTIPNSVTFIDGYAFSRCADLRSVTIPNSVTKIGAGVFAECEKLITITSLNPSPANFGTKTFIGLPKGATLYVPKYSVNAYRDANRHVPNGLDTSDILPTRSAFTDSGVGCGESANVVGKRRTANADSENYPDKIKCIVNNYIAGSSEIKKVSGESSIWDALLWECEHLERLGVEDTVLKNIRIKSIEAFLLDRKMGARTSFRLEIWEMEASADADRLFRLIYEWGFGNWIIEKPPKRFFVYENFFILLSVHSVDRRNIIDEAASDIIEACFECGKVDVSGTLNYVGDKKGCGKLLKD